MFSCHGTNGRTGTALCSLPGRGRVQDAAADRLTGSAGRLAEVAEGASAGPGGALAVRRLLPGMVVCVSPCVSR